MHQRRQTTIGLVSVIALVVAACSTGSGSPAPASAGPASQAPASAAPAGSPAAAGKDVTFIVRITNNPVFDTMANGAKEAAAEFGGTVTSVGPSEGTPTGQIPYIQTATSQGVDGIIISANDKSAVASDLKAARAAGIKVVGMDSPPADDARDLQITDGRDKDLGEIILKMACEDISDCTGQIAILSGAANSPNQNVWVDVMKNALKTDPAYAKLELVKVAYGDDDPQKETNEANGLIQAYPDLKGILVPSSVGMVAAAQILQQSKNPKGIVLTGLALPSQMRSYIKDGTLKQFALWNMLDLGYLSYVTMAGLLDGSIKGDVGETFKAGRLGDRTIEDGGIIVVGPPTVFNAKNIDQFDW